jgi:hypothetical protein
LIVRVRPDGYEEAIARPFTRQFDMTGRPMKGWIVVGPQGYENDQDLDDWVRQGIDFAQALPPK